MVVRVGVTVHRYVSLSNARHWLVHTLKNTRGRGSVPQGNQEDDVALKDGVEIINTTHPDDQSQGNEAHSTDVAAEPSSILNSPEAPTTRAGGRGKGENDTAESQPSHRSSLPCSSPQTPPAQSVQSTGSTERHEESQSPGSRPKRKRREPAKKWRGDQASGPVKVQPNSTYEKIRLHCRMWRRPEGRLNPKLLNEYLDSIMFYLLHNPGVALKTVTHHYQGLFTPVDLMDLLEILEKLGCVKLMAMKREHKVSLFSRRSSIHITQGLDVVGADAEELIIEPTVDCCHRLGQYLTYIK